MKNLFSYFICLLCTGGKNICKVCRGAGVLERKNSSSFYGGRSTGSYRTYENCHSCGGKGIYNCLRCGGDGTIY